MNNLIIFAVVVFSHGLRVNAFDIANLPNFTKCDLEDNTCLLELLTNVKTMIGPTGIEEIGIPRIIPMDLENVTVTVLEYLNLELVKGQCLGIDTCDLIHYGTDAKDNFTRNIEITCKRVVIEGIYKISTNPFFADHNIFYDVSGCGNGSLVLEDWYMQISYPFGFGKREDGNIYYIPKYHEGSSKSEIQTKATVSADQIMFNKWNVTGSVLRFINKYWRIIFKYFFSAFHKVSMDYYYETYMPLFGNIPATEILNNDLTPYLTENRLCHS